jgi:NTE family protein
MHSPGGISVRSKLVVALLSVLVLHAGHAQEAAPFFPAASGSSLPAVAPSNRPSVGIALEGGGALGLAHIGVLQWLEDHRIPIDRISGTSMGALVGAIYATGHSPAELRSIATSDAFTRVFALQSSYADASFRRRQDRREIPQALTVGIRHGVALRNGLLTNSGVSEFLATNLFGYNREQLDYDRLPIPFRCVATDLTTLQTVTFASGPLPKAVRASISIPGVFSPVQDRNGHYYVDGGILDNLPTDVLRHDLHADTVIAVRLEDSPLNDSDISSIVGVLNRAFSAGIVHNVEQAEKLADVVIKVPVGNFSGTDYAKADGLIKVGYQAAEQNRAILLRYALDADGWKAYLAARESRRLPQPGLLRQVRIEGGEPGAVAELRDSMKHIEGQPITPASTENALKPVLSNGGVAATWETYSPQPISPTAAEPAPDTGILVRLNHDRTGPPYLLIGPDLAASTSNITRGEIELRLVDQNFGGFGSEFRTTGRIGYMSSLSAEYYRLLTPNGYFLEPRTGVLRAPVYIWANQKRVAERFQQNIDAGIEAGRTFSNELQVSAEWREQLTRWRLTTGSGGGPYLSGTAQTALLHIDIDKAAAGTVSPDGFRFSASVGALYQAAQSANAPIVQLSFSRTHPWGRENIFGISGEVNTYFRANVAEPYRFTLGGPMRLSASSFDEYRGTDTYLARMGYMHRIAALPTGLGHGLYAVLGYEAGEVWSPESHSFVRQDGSAGFLANTPLGLITLGASAGDAGHRKVFVTLGRWF